MKLLKNSIPEKQVVYTIMTKITSISEYYHVCSDSKNNLLFTFRSTYSEYNKDDMYKTLSFSKTHPMISQSLHVGTK